MERGMVIVDDQEEAKTVHTHTAHSRRAPATDSEHSDNDDSPPAAGSHEVAASNSASTETAIQQPSMFERLTQSGVWANRSLRDVSRTMQSGAGTDAFPT